MWRKVISWVLSFVTLCIAVPVQAHTDMQVGTTQMLGNGMVQSWIKRDHDGKPLAVGVTMTETALSGLPDSETEHGLETRLGLPQAADIPINHIAINWNPHGHYPPEIYGLPHFDVHFYLISPTARGQITTTKISRAWAHKSPKPAYIPAGYIDTPGSEVPMMGAHYINPMSPEFHGQIFTKTFLYGFYNGQMDFLEPMITKAYLESHPNITEPLNLPSDYRKPGYYPTTYSIHYDEARKEYTVALEGLVKR